MCSVILLRRPDHAWPLLVGANRDEMLTRPWLPPGRHWPDRPDIIAGIDTTGGGTWFGLNQFGVMATILNRTGTLGAMPGKRSRGELVLEALDHNDAVVAAEALGDLDPHAYRPFNLVVADNRDAYWLAHRGDGRITVDPIPEGLSMIAAEELNDPNSPRITRHRPRFRAAIPPVPEQDAWHAWQSLLTDRSIGPQGDRHDALCFRHESGFATVCHQLLALPHIGAARAPHWLFATATYPEGSVSAKSPSWDRVPVD